MAIAILASDVTIAYPDSVRVEALSLAIIGRTRRMRAGQVALAVLTKENPPGRGIHRRAWGVNGGGRPGQQRAGRGEVPKKWEPKQTTRCFLFTPTHIREEPR